MQLIPVGLPSQLKFGQSSEPAGPTRKKAKKLNELNDGEKAAIAGLFAVHTTGNPTEQVVPPPLCIQWPVMCA